MQIHVCNAAQKQNTGKATWSPQKTQKTIKFNLSSS
jgi:hypothetical protein